MTTRFAVAFVLLAAVGVAHADDDEDETSVLFMGGLNIGAAHVPGTTGFSIGAELSLPIVHFKGGCYLSCDEMRLSLPSWPSWIGIYTDYMRDFGTDTNLFTLGPEIGYGPFGVDGGLAIINDHSGWAVRPVLTLGLVGIYARFDRIEGETLSQFGVLLKYGTKLVSKSG